MPLTNTNTTDTLLRDKILHPKKSDCIKESQRYSSYKVIVWFKATVWGLKLCSLLWLSLWLHTYSQVQNNRGGWNNGGPIGGGWKIFEWKIIVLSGLSGVGGFFVKIYKHGEWNFFSKFLTLDTLPRFNSSFHEGQSETIAGFVMDARLI